MISVEEAKERVRKTLASKYSDWAIDPDVANAGHVSVALHPPTEREALTDQSGAEQWVREWASVSDAPGIMVDWIERAWPSLGRQRVPTGLRLSGADSVAAFAGGEAARRYRSLEQRAKRIREGFGSSPAISNALRKNAEGIRQLDEMELDRLLSVVEWLATHDVTDMRPRQLPIRGVDTKWIGAHRGLVTSLHGAITGRGSLGLVSADHLVRLRLLDPALATAGPWDFAAPARELDRLELAPSVVIVVENLETVLSMPMTPGAVVVHGAGFAIDVVATIAWVRTRPLIYWGDLDSHGFAILNRLRANHPRVTSVLMDVTTLLDHQDLWVDEPRPAYGTYPHLNEGELNALERLRIEGNVRLEQERIPIDYALRKLAALL